ncbi:conjugal transfer protein [Bifidobacterium longum]|uniref:conjugal transfer protein n=1 Tax=Bifidobacterium longum TaxID=216816 RepID=UPI001BE43BA9|nr:conjugal transfer protein [Bifidobacterium longum]
MTEIHLIFQNHLNIFSNPVGRESGPCACFQRAILHCSVGSRNQNLFFTQDGEQVKVSISVKYLDQRTKATQISQFDLTLEKDSNWKIVG